MNNLLFEQFRNTSKRIPAIDFLKLFASVLVIFSHCMLKYIDNGDSNPVFNLIWISQMPLFMFASGIVSSSPHKLDSLKKYFYKILKDACFLLFPCLTFMLFTSLLTGVSVSSLLVKFYQNPESNLWFLWVLFWIHVIFNFGIYISTKFKWKFATLMPDVLSISVAFVITLLLLLLSNSFNFDVLSIKLLGYYLPFYVIGHIFMLFIKSRFAEKPQMQIVFYSLLIISVAIVVTVCFVFESVYRFDDSKLLYLVIRLITSICAVYMFLVLADLLTRKTPIIIISRYGAFSLQSYYIHMLIIRFINYSTPFIEHQWFLSFITGLLLIVSIILCLIIMYFIPFLHLLIFGKSFSKYDFEKKLPILFR